MRIGNRAEILLVGAGGLALLLGCWIVGPRRRGAVGEGQRMTSAGRSDRSTDERGHENARGSAPASRESGLPPKDERSISPEGLEIPDEEAIADRDHWDAAQRLAGTLEPAGLRVGRLKMAESLARYLGFDGQRTEEFEALTESVVAEIEQAWRTRDAGAAALSADLPGDERARWGRKLQEEFQQRRSLAVARIVAMLGWTERGRRFVAGRLDDWVDALGWAR